MAQPNVLLPNDLAVVGPAIANAPVVVPSQPTTLRELYRQMPDVYNGTYQGFLGQYGEGAATSEELMSLTKRFPTTVPNVFIYLDSNGVIKSVAQVHSVEVIIGQPGTWDQSVFAFNSEVIHGHVGTVLLPTGSFFATVQNIIVPTVVMMEALLTALPAGTNYLGPYNVDDMDTEEIVSRRAVPVPHAYVPLVFNQSFSPTEAWHQIGMQIIADNRSGDCAVLLNFLRGAAVLPRRLVGQHAPILPAMSLPLPLLAPVVDASLLEHQHRYLSRLLPTITNPEGQVFLQQQLAQTHYAIQTNLQAQTIAHQVTAAASQAATAPKTFSSIYPANAQSLRKLCDAGDDDENLPEFWKLFAAANGKKQQCFPALEALLTTRANDPTSARVQPILPAKLYDSLAHFKLGNPNIDDINLGLSPFMMCPSGYFKADSQLRTNALYTSLHPDGGTASLADLQTLLVSSFNLPSDLLQLIEFVGSYSVMVDVLLGTGSPLAIAVHAHYDFLFLNMNAVRSLVPEADLIMFMMRILRFIQIISINYINAKMNLQTLFVADPSFFEIESAIKNRMFNQFPAIPVQYLADVNQAAGRLPVARARAPPAIPIITTTVPPVARAPKVRTNEPANDQVKALPADVVQAWVQAFSLSAKSIRMLRALPSDQQPTATNGSSKICLSWHLKGLCYANCMNRGTHRPLDTTEAGIFQTFCSAVL
jgi:hypothetical protein